MRFDYVPGDHLPPGAWLLRSPARGGSVEVHHGRAVTPLDDAFFAGVWSGPFHDGNIVDAPERMGSGAAWRDGRLLLLPPTHPYDLLAAARVDGELFVSNSLAFLAAHIRARPIAERTSYFHTLQHTSRTPTADARLKFDRARIALLRMYPYVVERDGTLRGAALTPARPFTDFASYRGMLAAALHDLAANAQAAEREQPYGLSASISGGFDSSASLALATTAGWKHAVTFARDGDPDDGRRFAPSLGCSVVAVSPDAWKSVEGVEPDFLVTGGPDASVRLAGANDAFTNALVVLGSGGDLVWERGVRDLRPGYGRNSLASAAQGLTEWLLRINAVQIPVPAIGAINHSGIVRVGRECEAAGFSVGGDYDRVVARRLLIDAGVPPDVLATRKRGSSHLRLPDGLAPASRADFDEWMAEHVPARRARVHDAWRTTVRRTRRVVRRRQPTVAVLRRQWRPAHLFHWAVDRVRGRYVTP